MKLFFSTLFIIGALSHQNAFGEEQSFREKIRERIKEKLIQREKERPAPTLDTVSSDKITKPGDYTLSIPHGTTNRFYKMHVPAKYNPQTPNTLLIALHGGGGAMEYQANDKYYKQISKSDSEGFIAVFPNGFSKFQSGKFATWNAGKCCGAARDTEVDDVGFIKDLIAKVSSQLNIDKNKIFATGMSNGGMMSYRLACEMSDVFKGIASVTGTDNTIKCTPKNPVNILHIHARDDDHVLFNGGAGKGLDKTKGAVTNFISVPATIEKWVKFNECNATPKRVLEIRGAYCDLYSQCKNNVEVKLCVTDIGGHSWPGGEKIRGGADSSKAISANDVMWDFFRTK